MNFVARKEELEILEYEYTKKDSSFIAVYGRRRIGKTALINHFLSNKESITFSVTGAYNVKLGSHLENFAHKLSLAFGIEEQSFKSWSKAFIRLQEEIEKVSFKTDEKISIFIDELPWLAEMKDNGFKGALSLFWNDFASKRDDIFLVVCGSATAWIIDHIVDDHGSLSNRITAQIHLEVFSLRETKEFLLQQGHKGLSHKSIVDYYMVLGGVAHYLKRLNPKRSFVQNIQKLFFEKNGILRSEYTRLFRSLFKNHQTHELVVEYLARSWSGERLIDLSKKKGLVKGIVLSNALKELEASNIISRRYKYKQIKRDVRYGVSDPFIYFFNRWVKHTAQIDFIGNEHYFQSIYKSQAYKSWCGFAFESIAHQHIVDIKTALGIRAVNTQNYYWQSLANDSVAMGTQIDILLERADDVVNIIECKYYAQPFNIDKKYARELENKEFSFQESSNYMGSIQIVMLTVAGLKKNAYSEQIVSEELTLDTFFS
jgi:AAA+ ATPase superfamily predicted ATPase